MTTTPESNARARVRFTKSAAEIGCIFFVIAVVLSPGPGSSIGMPWPVFWCTWGVSLVAAAFALGGYFACRLVSDRISAFYAICPLLLFIGFLEFYNLRSIIHAFVPNY